MAMALARWNPIREMQELHRMIDRFFEEFTPFADTWMARRTIYPVDLYETDNAIVIQAALPGVKPEDIQVTFENGVVTLRAKVEEEKKEEARGYYLRERGYGEIVRSFTLPVPVDPEQAEAKLENGLLTITLPKAQHARPKAIPVKAS